MPEIRKATEAEIKAVNAIYEHILTQEECGRAHIGWVRGVYPTEQTAREAWQAGELFVLTEGGSVCAAARINQTQVPEYAGARWSEPEADPAQVMRRARIRNGVRRILRAVCAGAWLPVSAHGHQ